MDDLSLPGQRRDNLYPAGLQGFSSKWKALSKWMQSPDGETEIAEAKKDAQGRETRKPQASTRKTG